MIDVYDEDAEGVRASPPVPWPPSERAAFSKSRACAAGEDDWPLMSRVRAARRSARCRAPRCRTSQLRHQLARVGGAARSSAAVPTCATIPSLSVEKKPVKVSIGITSAEIAEHPPHEPHPHGDSPRRSPLHSHVGRTGLRRHRSADDDDEEPDDWRSAWEDAAPALATRRSLRPSINHNTAGRHFSLEGEVSERRPRRVGDAGHKWCCDPRRATIPRRQAAVSPRCRWHHPPHQDLDLDRCY